MHTLARNDFRSDGIFGTFTFDGETEFCKTLEHAYLQTDGSFQPKLKSGVYTCILGIHALENGIPFNTFEIKGVIGHSGILFHAGNYNRDSKGCVLLGHTIITDPKTGEQMVTSSRVKFKAWMEKFAGNNSFQLNVI